MAKTKIKTIFWDFDGVIIDSVDIKGAVFKEMYQAFGIEIAEKVYQYHHNHGGVSRYDKFRYFHKVFLNKDLSENEIADLGKTFSQKVLDQVLSCHYIPGAYEFLKKYYKQYDFFIISGTPNDELQFILKKRGINHFFKEAYGSPHSKDYWVELLLQKYDFERDEVLFIGDAESDYKAALNAKLNFLLRTDSVRSSFFKNYFGPAVENFLNWHFKDIQELF